MGITEQTLGCCTIKVTVAQLPCFVRHIFFVFRASCSQKQVLNASSLNHCLPDPRCGSTADPTTTKHLGRRFQRTRP